MTPMTPQEARAVERVTIVPGESYEFYAEMEQEYEPPEKRMRNYTGQMVMVVRNLRGRDDPESEYDGPGPNDVVDYEAEDGPGCFEVSRAFIVRTADGTEFTAMEEELNGWDKDLGQFFGPEGVPSRVDLSSDDVRTFTIKLAVPSGGRDVAGAFLHMLIANGLIKYERTDVAIVGVEERS
jgi:hypothetical protein